MILNKFNKKVWLSGIYKFSDCITSLYFIKRLDNNPLYRKEMSYNTYLKFFFFIPDFLTDHKGLFWKSLEVIKKKIRIKPGYIKLWIKYRQFFNKFVNRAYYRQRRITNFVLLWNTTYAVYFRFYYNIQATYGPANNLYNWKFVN